MMKSSVAFRVSMIALVAVCVVAVGWKVLADRSQSGSDQRSLAMPLFLQGTWKAERIAIFEHWDVLSPERMLGLSYKLESGQPVISEYLRIERKGRRLIYSSTVPGQNGGSEIQFTLKETDGREYSFRNPTHDFPRLIFYEQLSDTLVGVKVTNESTRGFAYRLIRVGAL